MGQKANPNVSQKESKHKISSGSFHNSLEFSSILKDQILFANNFSSFFEKKRCLVKECFYQSNFEKSSITIFISFLILKNSQKRKRRVFPILLNNKTPILKKVFQVLNCSGYFASKRLVFCNLNVLVLNYQKHSFFHQNFDLKNILKSFRREPYYRSSLFLFYLINILRNSSSIFSKFIAQILRKVHRKEGKLKKFCKFLSAFIKGVYQLKLSNSTTKTKFFQKYFIEGIKIKIKGRFARDARSEIIFFQSGSVPLQTTTKKISYSLTHSYTSFGVFGVKVWISN